MQISSEILTLVIALCIHAVATIWWAATITTQIKVLNDSLVKLDRELEKRDVQIGALWKRVDNLFELVNNFQHKGD